MVAGHLREQNGYYQMVLNWKGKDGKRKSKSISTRLTVAGNKAKADWIPASILTPETSLRTAKGSLQMQCKHRYDFCK